MTEHQSKKLQMTLREVNQQRHRFQKAPLATSSSEELPLLEKQAIVDEILRGMPIREIEMHEQSGPGGKVYLVTKGWPQLCAIFDFLDNKFPTWSDADRKRWEQELSQ